MPERRPNDNNPMEMGNLQRQAIAGLLEMTVANSAKDDKDGILGYRPAIIDTIPGLVGAVTSLIRGKELEKNSYLRNSVERSIKASERTNKALNISMPRNTSETLARVSLGLALPGPKGASIARTATKVVPRTAKAIGKVASATPKPVRAVTRGVAELAVPFRQTKTAKGLAAATGVSTAAGDVLSENFDPNYESSVLKVGDRPDDFFEDIETYVEADPSAEPQEDDFFAAIQTTPTVEEIDRAENEEEWNKWEQAGVVLATLGLGAVGVKYARQAVNSRLQSSTEDVARFVGKKFRRSRGGLVERAKTALIQQDTPLRNAAREHLSPQQAKDFNYEADLINNVSIGDRIGRFYTTGKAPKSTVKTQRLDALLEAYSKELSLDEQRTLEDALLAQSALDDVQRTGTQSALNLDRNGQPVSTAQLRAQVATARANPKYVKYMDSITKSYQDLLKFRVDRGILSVEMAQELATKRPNYVRMSRNLATEAKQAEATPFNANEMRSPGFSRNEDELMGVQGVTGVGSPINALVKDWAESIRLAEHNDLRKSWLEQMYSSNARDASGKRIVQRIPNGTKPNTMEGVHQVYKNGKLEMYKVNDGILSSALEISPRSTYQLLEQARQIYQNTITGPLGTLFNAFSLIAAPAYDAGAGQLLRQKGVVLGSINEMLSKVNPKLNIGVLDPTVLTQGYTGAARYLWADTREALSRNLSQQLLQEGSKLRSMIGDNAVTAIRDRIDASLQNSVKSIGDELGVFSKTMHGSPDPSDVLSGLESIAPRYTSVMAEQLAKDTLEARRAGEVGPLASALAQGNSAFAKVRANRISRLYGALLEASHNGFRYSVLANNVKRNSNLKELAAQARRISGDAAQHGGSDTINRLTSGVAYYNISVQVLARAAEMIAKEPHRFVTNALSTALPIAAMYMLGQAYDPEAQEAHRAKSASQRASRVTTFGGAEIPIDPLSRFFVSPMIETMDAIFRNEDGSWNTAYLDALETWLDNDATDKDLEQNLGDTFDANWRANVPISIETLPFGTAILAGAGLDPGMSRITDEASPVRMQGVSGLDMDRKKEGSLLNGELENFIASIGGAFTQGMVQITDDAYRAAIDPQGRAGPLEALKVGMSGYEQRIAKAAGPAKPLFSDYESVKAVTDVNWSIVRDKEKGMEQATKVFDSNVATAGMATGKRRGDEVLPSEYQGQSMAGTANSEIGAFTKALNSALKENTAQLQDLARYSEQIRNGYVQTADKKARDLNELTEQRKLLNYYRRQMIESYEEQIREAIGDPNFSFEDYDPRNYMQPIKPRVVQ